MANLEKIEEIERSIADWEAKKAAGTGFAPEVVEEILTKLKNDLEAAKAE